MIAQHSRQTGGFFAPLFTMLVLALVLLLVAASKSGLALPGFSGDTWQDHELVLVYEVPTLPSYQQIAQAPIHVRYRYLTVDTSQYQFPEPPDCKKLRLREECKWRVNLVRHHNEANSYAVEVELVSGERVVGYAELRSVALADYTETAAIAGTVGTETGWMGFVQVSRAFLGNGVGRLVWQAGDAALKILALREGQTIYRIFFDAAGWGHALIRDVPPEWIVYAGDPLWLYRIP